MGMNGGIRDAINLAGKLAQVLDGQPDDDVLGLYSRQRRYAAVNYVQAQTIANKKLREECDPQVRQQNFDDLRRSAEDLDSARAYMRRADLFETFMMRQLLPKS